MTVRLIRTRRFADSRGWFAETWNRARLLAEDIDDDFVQDNESLSLAAGTLRGLHYQRPPHAQAKLVRCVRGRVHDVAVDLRRASPTFGKWTSAELSADNGDQLYIPVGYAHGFMTLEPESQVAYKVSAPYAPSAEGGIAWNDATLAIDWPLPGEPLLSDKDALLPPLAEADFAFSYDGAPLLPLDAR